MKTLLRIVALLLIVACVTTLNTFADNHSAKVLDSYVKAAEQFIMANPLEKVYLHMDNTSYFMGDTVWFKAYAVNAAQNKPTEESEILHVELLNPEGVIVSTQKYRLKGGKCAGSLPISKELLSGFFEIRAYTKAMLNFGDQNYFTRVFPVFEGTQQSPEILDRLRTVGYTNEKPSKKEVKQAEKEQKKAPHYKVHFYPEGGNLVNGVTSKVAFQITNYNGEWVDDIECTLYDGKRSILTTSSQHQGVGVFEITPDASSKYYMKIEGYYERATMPDDPEADSTYYLNPDGDYERAAMSDILIVWKDSKIEYELPEVYQDGCVVSVDCLSNANDIIINAASTYDEPIGMVVIGRDGIATTEEFTHNKQISINKNNLCEGVNQVVLYNRQGKELASRLFFVRNGKQPQLTITPSKAGKSKPHARQNITFKVADDQGNGIATDFSLSIYDDATAEGTPQQSIYTSLLLSSELRGYIPNADYYFDADDSERTKNLDLIMMVHGWSRYKWDEMSGYTPTENMFEYEKGLMFYGRAYEQLWDDRTYYKPTGTVDSNRDPVYASMDQPFPTDKVVPYTDLFYINYEAKVDKAVANSSLSTIPSSIFTSNGKDNRFCIEILDFEGNLNIYGHIKLSRRNLGSAYIKSIFLTYSEYKPKERLYDFDETRLGGHVVKNKMVDYPSLKVPYYNRGHFCSFYDNFKTSIYESNVNTPFTSLENYLEYYDLPYIEKNMSYHVLTADIINNPLTSTNELLYYNKMPYGTVSYISTLVEKRFKYGISNEYITTPLKYEFITVRKSPYATGHYTYPGGINFYGKEFNFVIDSTIIHTSLEKRMEIYDKYKDHEQFNVFRIDNRREVALQTSSNRCPDYIVEYIGRKVNTPVISSKPYRSTSPRVFVFQGFESGEREFYSPDYSVVTPPSSGDHRRTLYWNPNVESDAEGKATITFYNNSQGGSYTIDAQTITANGEMGTITK